MILEIENMSYKIEGQSNYLLHDINLSLKEGEMKLIKGPSGSGKSTLLFLCGALLFPSKGSIVLFDKISSETNELSIRNKIGYVFQSPVLFDHLKVIDNFRVCGKWMGQDQNMIDKISVDYLERFHLLEFQNQYPRNLSGGQKQRIALINALILNPNLLLLDEPLGSVDFETKKIIIDYLIEIKKAKISSLIVSHDSIFDNIADQIYNLKNGTLSSLN